MKLSSNRNRWSALFALVFVAVLLAPSYLALNLRAQEGSQLPARVGYVNDFARVLDDTTKERLETALDNLKKKSGIELSLATIQTTGNQDIFAFSRQLAGDWGVGSPGSTRKSVLLVVSVDEKAVFTRPSRSVQGELPEGILAELNQRVRGSISAGRFGQGLVDGVDHFVAALAKKVGFSLEDFQRQPVSTVTTIPVSPSTPETTSGTGVEATTVETAAVQETAPSASRPRFAGAGGTPSVPPTSIDTAAASLAPENESAYAWMSPTNDDSEEVELTLTLPLPERIAKLKEFMQAYPNSTSKPRAIELLISSYASLGDQRLKSGDNAGGTQQFMLAISEAPENISEKLFSGVVAQIPSNLFLRGQRSTAVEAAQKIEMKFGGDAKRLLALAGFYLGIEDGSEAARLAAQSVKLNPNVAEAHHVLGLGLHISLRLDEAAGEYRRALELDPNSKRGTRRSLADLTRAAGKAEEALELYREQLRLEPSDKAARAGVVLSLFDLGKLDDGNKELTAALEQDPRNVALLAGAAYWFAAHNEAERSLELARKAVQIEPRYTWSQIALGRALIGIKNPLEAERALRFARQYGNFPTLDYELANVLSAAGLYEEAGEVLLQSFTFKDEKIEARLAGRVQAQESDFIQLLAPERRAAIFQFASADSKSDAAMLKALLAFSTATSVNDSAQLDEAMVSRTAKQFAAGPDNMRVYRQLYAAGVLVRKGVALQTAYELTEAARTNVEAGLEVPAATVAAQAEELRDIRARAIAKGSTPDVPAAARNVLANIIRGRIEDTAGWVLYNQGKASDAVEHLKRASGILPEGTPLWRNALWHLGAALDQSGNSTEALGYYIKSYNAGNPDSGRRAVIERLYQKANGSLNGLDERIGANRVAASVSSEPNGTGIDKAPGTTSSTVAPEPQPTASPELPAPSDVVQPNPGERAPATPEANPDAKQAPPTPAPVVENAVRSAAASEPNPRAGSGNTVPGIKTRLRATVKLTGTVRDATNAPLANVVVVLISPRGSVLASTTDSDGNYSFVVSPSPLSYRLIPSKDGHTFEPVDRVLAGIEDDQKSVDFISKAPPKE
jgi:tetratricopeptide (TPR) repeat protein